MPFVYSNEVWTGIEYQVAAHLMFEGEVEKGLEIVRTCRDRYNGRVRIRLMNMSVEHGMLVQWPVMLC